MMFTVMKSLVFVGFIIGWFSHASVSQNITKIELVDGPNQYSGRVEIVNNGIKGTICVDNFDNKDAAVVCRMLGYSNISPIVLTYIVAGTGKIWLDDMECQGNEFNIGMCQHRGWGIHNCGHNEDVGVSCIPEYIWRRITNIELVDGPNQYTGRVEIVYNGIKGTVCDDGFDYQDAAVVCRMLGYSNISPVVLTDVVAGTGKIWLDDMKCHGYESSIELCEHAGWGVENCNHYEDVGVSCVPEYISHTITNIELVDGPNKFSGRVEIVSNGIKGTICDDRFDDKDAAVVCRMLGYDNAFPNVLTDTVAGTGKIWLDDMECQGNESNIICCKHADWGVHNCGHYEDVGVSCFPKNAPISKIELVDGANQCHGRVEIVFNGERGTICDDYFDSRDAAVICTMLGFRDVTPVALTGFGGGFNRIWLDDMDCIGNELQLQTCKHAGWGKENCTHIQDVGVSCFSNININSGITPSSCTPLTTCTFESENICNYIQDDTDDFNWIGNSGSTSSKLTGPSHDHTYGNSSGHYMYIESSNVKFGEKAILLFPVYPLVSTDQYLQFYYHMYGSHIGTLNVKIRIFNSTGNAIWTKSGNQHDRWHIAQVPLEANQFKRLYQVSFWIVFEGIGGNGYEGDIAIDDVSITTMICQKSFKPSWTVHLINGQQGNAGRVRVEIGQVSGFICDEDFDDLDASVICKMLGFSYGYADPEISFGITSGPFLLDGVKCNGYESSVEFCKHRGLFNSREVCNHNKAAGVICHSDANREKEMLQNSLIGLGFANCVLLIIIAAGIVKLRPDIAETLTDLKRRFKL